jgi:hypothetical protein
MGFEERWLADTELLARAGAKFGGRRTSTTHQSTIDIAEPGREVERAAVIFAHGERDSQQAIASLRMAFSPSQFFVGKMSLRCSRTRRITSSASSARHGAGCTAARRSRSARFASPSLNAIRIKNSSTTARQIHGLARPDSIIARTLLLEKFYNTFPPKADAIGRGRTVSCWPRLKGRSLYLCAFAHLESKVHVLPAALPRPIGRILRHEWSA